MATRYKDTRPDTESQRLIGIWDALEALEARRRPTTTANIARALSRHPAFVEPPAEDYIAQTTRLLNRWRARHDCAPVLERLRQLAHLAEEYRRRRNDLNRDIRYLEILIAGTEDLLNDYRFSQDAQRDVQQQPPEDGGLRGDSSTGSIGACGENFPRRRTVNKTRCRIFPQAQTLEG